MKEVDVLWFVEHIAREMDVACIAKHMLESYYGVTTEVRHIYLHIRDNLKSYMPLVLVFPFFYKASDLAIEDYVERWPNAVYFNLAWEEIYYKTQAKLKVPGDFITKERVIHHAWGDFFKEYLVSSGVPTNHVFVNGNPAYQLYRDPYNLYYKPREQLAREHSLDPSLKWIFIPENYRWAFFSDQKLSKLVRQGADIDEVIELRDFCKVSLLRLLAWCVEASKYDTLQIIFRPRPATHSEEIKSLFQEHIGGTTGNLRIIKKESVREWIMASDIVISSYSTSLIEAAVADKPAYMVEPLPIPESLYCNWYDYVPRITTAQDFFDLCLSKTVNVPSRLKRWAETEMLGRGDPIKGLVKYVSSLVQERRQQPLPQEHIIDRMKLRIKLNLPRRKVYFNTLTHENDVFSAQDVVDRVASWRRILGQVD
ncbi:MAG: hypothetical protein AB1374_00135 [Bacillota bacterium]